MKGLCWGSPLLGSVSVKSDVEMFGNRLCSPSPEPLPTTHPPRPSALLHPNFNGFFPFSLQHPDGPFLSLFSSRSLAFTHMSLSIRDLKALKWAKTKSLISAHTQACTVCLHFWVYTSVFDSQKESLIFLFHTDVRARLCDMTQAVCVRLCASHTHTHASVCFNHFVSCQERNVSPTQRPFDSRRPLPHPSAPRSSIRIRSVSSSVTLCFLLNLPSVRSSHPPTGLLSSARLFRSAAL